MDGVLEIITGRERRRRWSTEFKLRVVAETQAPEAQVRAVAARHGVCESLVFTWRRQVRDGVLTASEVPMFMPVQMLEAPVPSFGRRRIDTTGKGRVYASVWPAYTGVHLSWAVGIGNSSRFIPHALVRRGELRSTA